MRRVPRSCPSSVLVVCCRVEVWHILFALLVLIQSFIFRYAILDLVAYRHYKDSTLLLCTHIVGGFFCS